MKCLWAVSRRRSQFVQGLVKRIEPPRCHPPEDLGNAGALEQSSSFVSEFIN
ncbi:MAG TPA: hypothetical protein VJQ57_03910 [Acidimicrobiia bacterium]|nr:hypothetical protein [Acidimicrobiia bacterium]